MVADTGWDSSTAAVTFGDLAGSTALTEAHGDIAAADIAEQLVAHAESVLGSGDRLVKAIGDAVLFTSVDAASAITLDFRLFDDACEKDARFPTYGPACTTTGRRAERRSLRHDGQSSRPGLPRKPQVDKFLATAPSRTPRRRSVLRWALAP